MPGVLLGCTVGWGTLAMRWQAARRRVGRIARSCLCPLTNWTALGRGARDETYARAEVWWTEDRDADSALLAPALADRSRRPLSPTLPPAAAQAMSSTPPLHPLAMFSPTLPQTPPPVAGPSAIAIPPSHDSSDRPSPPPTPTPTSSAAALLLLSSSRMRAISPPTPAPSPQPSGSSRFPPPTWSPTQPTEIGRAHV